MAYNKNKRNELENTEKTLLSLLEVVEKLNKAMNPDIIKNYKAEFHKLNDSLLEDYKLNVADVSINAINNRLYQVRQRMLKSIKGNGTVNKQDAALDALFDNLVQSEIKKYRQKIIDTYEDMSEKERKRVGSKEDYVNKWTNKFASQFTRSVGNNFSFTRDINSALGIGTNKKDIYNLVASSRSEVDTRVAREQKKAVKELNDAADKWSKVGDVFQSIGKSLWKTFLGSANKQTSVYESTYGYLSARTNINQSTYRLNQWNTAKDLLTSGLGSNVATSEVMQMWNDLSKVGMSSENIFATALDNVITNKILPYLDTTSTSINLLNSKLNNNFIKDIRGINLASLEIAGNNYLTQDLLQTIIDQVQPMSDEALDNLAQGSTEVTAMINSLIAQGVDQETAKAYATQLFKAQRYSDQMLRSGSTTEQLFISDLLQNGINIFNPSEWNDAIGLSIGRQQNLLGGFNYDDTYNGMITNLYGRSLGIDYGMANAAINLNKKGITAQSLVASSNLSPTQYAQFSTNATGNLNKGQYQTASQRQSILMENLSTGVAIIEEMIGSYGVAIVDNLTNIFHAIIGTGVTNTLSSTLASGKFGALLGAGGPIALGVGAVGAGIVAGIAVTNQLLNKNDSEVDEYAGNLTENMLNQGVTQSMGAAQATSLIKAQSKDKMANMSTGKKQSLGIKTSIWKSSKGEYKSSLKQYKDLEDWGSYNQLKAIAAFDNSTGLSEIDKFNVMGAMLLQALYGNVLDLKGGPLSKAGVNITTAQDLAEFLYMNQIGKTRIEAGANLINANGWNLVDIYGKPIYGTLSQDIMNVIKGNTDYLDNFNAHRQGLAEVPYDNYAAMLHAGETVLTASTTAALNDLVMEYRNSQNQNYSLDAAIQNQTAQLIQKMDEIIHNMNLTSQNNRPINSVAEKLRNNMFNLTGSLSFQN